ncbi:MAG: hypothetical protein QOG53_3136 [Frankiales bacterium]|jgi:hypothetical protein|nr:hypothetical protein [Frankiales bacterium]
MTFSDLLEVLIGTDWSRRFVFLRGVVVIVMAIFFSRYLMQFIVWMADQKADEIVRHLGPLLAPAGHASGG